jgi:hypothetical protein
MNFLKKIFSKFIIKQYIVKEENLIAIGKLLSNQVIQKESYNNLFELEFKIFSQWGDDGIIQWLINNILFENKIFIEFGVSDYIESNTRFLLFNNNWKGIIFDGSSTNITNIKNSDYFWKFNLQAEHAFIDSDNINDIISKYNLPSEIGLLHIDIDGNDYWVLKNLKNIKPVILILEYNSVFGYERAITVPYDKTFNRTEKHHSNLYFGASLLALYNLANELGYSFIGCTSAGNNAFFVRNDKINNKIKILSVKEGFIESNSRESRDINGVLNYLSGEDRYNNIKGMPIYNTITNMIEEL